MIRMTVFSHSSANMGGGEGALLELIDAIKDQVELCIVLPQHGQIEEILTKQGVATCIIDIPWWVRHDVIAVGPRRYNRVIKTLNALNKHLDDFQPDICLTNTSVIPWGAVAARQKGIPHVWYIHEMIDKKSEVKYEIDLKIITKIIEQLSDKVIANSEYCRLVLERDIAPEKIMTILPILHLPSLDSENDIIPSLYQGIHATGGSIVLIPARIIEGKGQMDAVRAIKKLHDDKRNVHLVLMGTSEPLYRKSIESYVSRNHIGDIVHILPFVDTPQTYIKYADVVLNTSRLESFGRSTIEAMYARVPVVGADNTATGHMISSGYNGLTYATGSSNDLSTKIAAILDDESLRKDIIKGGYHYALSQYKATQKNLADFPDILTEVVSQEHVPDIALAYVCETLNTQADNINVGNDTSASRRDSKVFKIRRIVGKVVRKIRRMI